MANILIIEAEENILQEVVTFLSERTHCQVTHLSPCPDTLSFSRTGNPPKRANGLPGW